MFALRLCIVMSVLAIIGCDAVIIDSPIGEKLQQADITKLMGRWTDEAQNIIELHLSDRGDVIFGVLSWNDQKQRFEAVSNVLDVRTVDESIYVFSTEDDASDDNAGLDDLESDNSDKRAEKKNAPRDNKPQFIFFQVKSISESEIHIFLPDIKAVRNAIEMGKLDAMAEKRAKTTDVLIKASEAKSQTFIASKQWATLFQNAPTFKLKLIKKAT
jgi:hypothetical protein